MRWRVQAFLLPHVTGGVEAPYQPRYFRTWFGAIRQRNRLWRSFNRGDVRIEMRHEPRRPSA
jgi:hypothetical protein